MAAYMWNGLQPVTSFTLIPNPNPNLTLTLALTRLFAALDRADVFEP